MIHSSIKRYLNFSHMRSDDGTINLRTDKNNEDDAEFKINSIEEADKSVVGKVEAVNVNEYEEAAMQPHDKVKVKFDKFVNLVATHAYEEVFEKHIDEDILMSEHINAVCDVIFREGFIENVEKSAGKLS